MLDTATKRRIDTARDILVGKVPDPKSQVEQITIALIYKFMDDIDAESEELGGQRTFFAGDFARYGWPQLVRAGLGGHETLNLYAEAITRMPENPGIPLLFRDIFNNAYLPYRDPETLRAFLKVIDEFTYDHSERLGDAFEYLLSVLGSQGDAGQFRTPRHIIDFIVSVIDPKKDEKILDPACGTAGFLISSYKHILKSNIDDEGNNTLTPDEKGTLAANVRGYDISPDMVRLSLVNLYLHDFREPHIFEYDTLTSEERWNEYADVILANPPFMSPKGGIRPHRRFSVQSKRSEVLFVDYIAEHLTPTGRAGIIVPEGIIFQSQTAHKQLRKMLVENYLVAVISLPAGVFQPYSGVKTSILLLDKALAQKTDRVAFFKVENDGFDLGAQRREIAENDLPKVREELGEYLGRLRTGESVTSDGVAESGVEYTADNVQPKFGLVAEKGKIAAGGEYNLSGERYRENQHREHSFPLVSLGDSELFCIESGGTPKSRVEEYWDGGVPWATLVDLPPTELIAEIRTTQRTISETGLAKSSAKLIPENSVIVSTRATIGRIGINRIPLATNQGFKNIIVKNLLRAMPEYIALAVTKLVPTMNAWASGGTFKEISKSKFCELQISLPPLEVQREIVAEIEGYQRVIDGARAVIDNYRPQIVVDPEWLMVTFAEAPFEIIDGDRGVNYPKKEDFSSDGYCVFLNTKNVRSDGFNFNEVEFITREKDETLRKGRLRRGDVVLTTRGTIGNTGYYDNSIPFDAVRINSGMLIFRSNENRLSGKYLFQFFQSQNFKEQRDSITSGAAQPQLPIRSLNEAKIPVPNLETQQAIVAEIEAEQSLVAANRELVERMEGKIRAAIGRVWNNS